MNIILSIEHAIESSVSFVWRITPGKVWIILALIGVLSGSVYGFMLHERGIGYDNAKAEDKAYTDSIEKKLAQLPAPSYSILDQSLNAQLPPLPTIPDCAPVDLKRVRNPATRPSED